MTHFGPHVRPSLEEDCEPIAANLRSADLRECEMWGLDPLHSLRTGLQYSLQPLTIVGHSGNPCAMFGVTYGQPDATIWLLGTDEMFDLRISFLRRTTMWLEHICKPLKAAKEVTAVANWVDLRNVKHTQWLLWAGFEKTSTRIAQDLEIAYFRKAL